MGTSLRLHVPESEERAVIDSYYEYVVEKLQNREAEWAPEEKTDYTDYQLTMERYTNEGVFYLYEIVPNTVAAHMDWDGIQRLFKSDGERQRTICDDEELETLIRHFRNAIEPLEEEQPRRNWADNLETKAIALCEFARQNDYCVELVSG